MYYISLFLRFYREITKITNDIKNVAGGDDVILKIQLI